MILGFKRYLALSRDLEAAARWFPDGPWQAGYDEIERRLRLIESALSPCGFASGGMIVGTGAGDPRLFLLGSNGGCIEWTRLPPTSGSVQRIAVAPDGSLIAAIARPKDSGESQASRQARHHVPVWFASGAGAAPIFDVHLHHPDVNAQSIAIESDGSLLIGCQDGRVIQFMPADTTGPHWIRGREWQAHVEGVISIAILEDGVIVTLGKEGGGTHGSVKSWDPADCGPPLTKRSVTLSLGLPELVLDLSLSPSRRAAAIGDSNGQLVVVRSGKETATTLGFRINCTAFIGEESLALGPFQDDRWYLHSVENGKTREYSVGSPLMGFCALGEDSVAVVSGDATRDPKRIVRWSRDHMGSFNPGPELAHHTGCGCGGDRLFVRAWCPLPR